MRPQWTALLLMTMTTGCASYELSRDDRVQGAGSDGDASSGSDGGGFDSAVGSLDDRYSWWRLDADLHLDEGTVTAEDSSLMVGVLDDTGVELCSMVGSVGTAASSLVLPDEVLLTWWVLDGIVWSGNCVPGPAVERLPAALSIGVGFMHPEIEAVLDGMPELVAGAGAGLNGGYAQLPGDDTVYVFGAVGPVSAWSGGGEPATEVPLEDGVWQVRGAYGFPL